MPPRSVDALPMTPFEASLLLVVCRSTEVYGLCADLDRRLSMLHADVLALLHFFGKLCSGPILEIGAYIGGATIALAKGREAGGQSARIISVEKGGSHPHPHYPSADILADLDANLREYRVRERVEIIAGHGRDPAIRSQILAALGTERVGCWLVDADGQFDADWEAYRDVIRPGAYIVVDDYFSAEAPEKAGPTWAAINALEAKGELLALGVFGYGTWIGRRSG